MTKSKNASVAVMMPASDRRLMTRREAAAYLGVSQATLSRWAADRTGPPFIKLHDGEAGGGAVRYPSDLMTAFIESRIKQPKQ
jgi:predicted DNA-binding transcriptional regulator AlpA